MYFPNYAQRPLHIPGTAAVKRCSELQVLMVGSEFGSERKAFLKSEQEGKGRERPCIGKIRSGKSTA